MPGGGRPKGSLNSLPAEIRKLIGDAGAKIGDLIAQKERDGLRKKDNALYDPFGLGVSGSTGLQRYLEWLAVKYPETYAALLSKILPKETNIDVTNTLSIQAGEARRYLERTLLIDLEADEVEPGKVLAAPKR